MSAFFLNIYIYIYMITHPSPSGAGSGFRVQGLGFSRYNFKSDIVFHNIFVNIRHSTATPKRKEQQRGKKENRKILSAQTY